MDYILKINYLVWLIISAIFFAVNEYFSEKFALNPSVKIIVYIVVIDVFCILAWLPAIYLKKQLSTVGTLWSVLSLLLTIAIGIFIFNDKLDIKTGLGIVFAIASVALLA